MSVLNPLGFVSLKLHYTPKHRHRIQGCPRRNSQCFLCKPGSGLSFSHCIKRWRNNHVLTAKCNALLIRTWQLSCHTCIWSAPVADSNTLNIILSRFFVFVPFPLSLFLSISLSQQWASRWAFRQVLFPTLVFTHSALTVHLTLCGSFSQAACKELWKC